MEESSSVKHKLKHTKYKVVIYLFIGLLISSILRFALYKPVDLTHYHANFGVFINGQQYQFDKFTYYEEVSSCSADTKTSKQRVHMHKPDNFSVHVHDKGVIWGDFFSNLGIVVGKDYLELDGTAYPATPENKISVLLNGKETSGIMSLPINNEDIVLIDYSGSVSDEIKKRYDQIPHDADHKNQSYDPASCQGHEKETLWTRIRKALINR